MSSEECWCDGEYTAYMQHRRRNETPCQPAKDAWAAHYRHYRKNRRSDSRT